jgi:adenylate cyclase
MRNVVVLGVLGLAAIYLFVSAPPPLPDEVASESRVPVRRMFELVAAENSVVRALYTKEIVGPGLAAGLAFDEDWRRADVEAGPLPALFLRSMAQLLERSPVPLSLFLGSDLPIRAENKFSGIQNANFVQVRATRAPVFFIDPSSTRYTAMFPDLASAQACVSCHNEHPDSPKIDWALDDVMGATTWLYPRAYLSTDELVEALRAVREAARATYRLYLDEAATFDVPPEVGDRWPRDGLFLPSEAVFMAEVARRASPLTLEGLFHQEPVDGDTP